MRYLIFALYVVTVSGCVTVPTSKLSWTSGDYVVSAKRNGCEIGGIEVTNNGIKVAKIFGTLDILDDQSNTISTVKFSCDNVHPGGSASCGKSQSYNEKRISEMPGYYCSGYSKYKLSLQRY